MDLQDPNDGAVVAGAGPDAGAGGPPGGNGNGDRVPLASDGARESGDAGNATDLGRREERGNDYSPGIKREDDDPQQYQQQDQPFGCAKVGAGAAATAEAAAEAAAAAAMGAAAAAAATENGPVAASAGSDPDPAPGAAPMALLASVTADHAVATAAEDDPMEEDDGSRGGGRKKNGEAEAQAHSHDHDAYFSSREMPYFLPAKDASSPIARLMGRRSAGNGAGASPSSVLQDQRSGDEVKVEAEAQAAAGEAALWTSSSSEKEKEEEEEANEDKVGDGGNGADRRGAGYEDDTGAVVGRDGTMIGAADVGGAALDDIDRDVILAGEAVAGSGIAYEAVVEESFVGLASAPQKEVDDVAAGTVDTGGTDGNDISTTSMVDGLGSQSAVRGSDRNAFDSGAGPGLSAVEDGRRSKRRARKAPQRLDEGLSYDMPQLKSSSKANGSGSGSGSAPVSKGRKKRSNSAQAHDSSKRARSRRTIDPGVDSNVEDDAASSSYDRSELSVEELVQLKQGSFESSRKSMDNNDLAVAVTDSPGDAVAEPAASIDNRRRSSRALQAAHPRGGMIYGGYGDDDSDDSDDESEDDEANSGWNCSFCGVHSPYEQKLCQCRSSRRASGGYLCALPHCPNFSQRARTNHMCKAHFTMSKKSISENKSRGGGSPRKGLGNEEVVGWTCIKCNTANPSETKRCACKAWKPGSKPGSKPGGTPQKKATPTKRMNPYAHLQRREEPRSKSKNCCGRCDACMVEDCGKCKFCLDMKRFGGKNQIRQKCMHRPPCIEPPMASPPVSTPTVSKSPNKNGLEPSSRLRERRAISYYDPSDLPVATNGFEVGRKGGAKKASVFSVNPTIGGETVSPPTPRPWRRPRPIDGPEPGSVDLEPLDTVEDIEHSDLPSTGRCEWSFDAKTRVLLGKFHLQKGSGPDSLMHHIDEKFMLEMMERDDISVVSEGLVDHLDPNIWDLRFVSGVAGDEPYHKVRRFSRQLVEASPAQDDANLSPDKPKQYLVTHKEEDKFISMKVSDYVDYLNKRATTLEFIAAERTAKGTHPVNPKDPEDDRIGRQPRRQGHEQGQGQDHEQRQCQGRDHEQGQDQVVEVPSPEDFAFSTHNGKERSINVVDDVLYLIDYDLPKLLPKLYDDFAKKFKMPECLPGGTHCMMNSVNNKGRPFMGPNFYVTPPASFTHFHQDGHGTVDSGHTCLSGYNEVIMLRRMPEKHKHRALYILNEREGKKPSKYDGLYGLPHADNIGEKPSWPKTDSIQKCADMNYCPSVFILKPGQFVHINKGRLHAFRKLSPTELHPSDCHFSMRSKLIEEEKLGSTEQICVSVAWDWMYKGVTTKGINNELVSTLECARLNRQHDTQSLAIPEASVLHMARQFASQHEREVEGPPRDTIRPIRRGSVLPFLSSKPKTSGDAQSVDTDTCRFAPSTLDVLKGIAPSLEFIVNRHSRAFEAAKQQHATQSGDGVSLAKIPNTWENPDLFALDPYGDGDFFCRKCGEELSNCYMHCDGCEVLLSKDYNICVNCHNEGRYRCFDLMNPFKDTLVSSLNHNVGTRSDQRRKNCPCRKGKPCKNCGYCDHCSCRCHACFTMHERFMTIEDEESLRTRVRLAVGGIRTDITLAKIDEDETKVHVEQQGEQQEVMVARGREDEEEVAIQSSATSTRAKGTQLCSIPGCKKVQQARNNGMCRAHFRKWEAGGDVMSVDDPSNASHEMDIVQDRIEQPHPEIIQDQAPRLREMIDNNEGDEFSVVHASPTKAFGRESSHEGIRLRKHSIKDDDSDLTAAANQNELTVAENAASASAVAAGEGRRAERSLFEGVAEATESPSTKITSRYQVDSDWNCHLCGEVVPGALKRCGECAGWRGGTFRKHLKQGLDPSTPSTASPFSTPSSDRRTNSKDLCAVSGCAKWSQGPRKNRMCQKHYLKSESSYASPSRKRRKHGPDTSTSTLVSAFGKRRKRGRRRLCAVSGCPKVADGRRSNYMCARHYRESESSSKTAIEHIPQKRTEPSKHAGSTDVAALLPEQFEQAEEPMVEHGPEEDVASSLPEQLEQSRQVEGLLIEHDQKEDVVSSLPEQPEPPKQPEELVIEHEQKDRPEQNESEQPYVFASAAANGFPLSRAATSSESLIQQLPQQRAEMARHAVSTDVNADLHQPAQSDQEGETMVEHEQGEDVSADLFKKSEQLEQVKEPMVEHEQEENVNAELLEQFDQPEQGEEPMVEHEQGADVNAELQKQSEQSQQGEELLIEHEQSEEAEQPSATATELPLPPRSSRPSRRSSRAATAHNFANDIVFEPKETDDLIKKGVIGLTDPFQDVKHRHMPGEASRGLNADVVRKLIEDTENEDEPTAGSIIRALPGIFDDKNENHRRIGLHLYRNFFGETDILENKKATTLPLSRRERDIIVYCLAERMGAEFCQQLLPYRDYDTIDKLYNAVKIQGYHENQEHVDHVRRAVGIIFELEGRKL